MFERLVWIVPAAVAVAGAWRPRAALLVLAACLPVFGSPPGGPYLAALDAAGLAAVAAAFLRRPPARVGPTPIGPAVALVALASLASLVPLAYRPPSFEPRVLAGLLAGLSSVQTWTVLYTWRAAASLLLGLGLYLAVRRAFAGRSPAALAAALGIGLCVTLALGLAGHADLIDLSGFRAKGGDLYATRLHSVFFHSGWLAVYTLIAAPFAVAGLATRGRSGRRAAALLAVLVLVTLPLTEQRGAWVAAAVQLAFLAIAARRLLARERRLRRAAGAVLLGASLLGGAVAVARPAMLDSLAARARQVDLSGRPHLWRAALELARERPFLGWGLGAFPAAYDRHHPPGSPGAWPFRGDAHSFYLTVLAQCGLAGVAAYALLAAGLAAAVGRALRPPPPAADAGPHRTPGGSAGFQPAVAVGLAASFVGFAVYGLVQGPFHLRNTEWLFWLLVAAAALLAPPAPAPRLRRIAAALAVGIACLLPWRASRLEPPHAGSRQYGLNEPERARSEGPIQWTTGRAAAALAWTGETLVVRLANGHPYPARHPVRVTVRAGRAVEELVLDRDGWREIRLPLGPPAAPRVVLQVRARPTFRPFSHLRRYPDLSPSADIRALGVALGGVRFEPAPPGSAPFRLP